MPMKFIQTMNKIIVAPIIMEELHKTTNAMA
jgi:hypothetical protein